MDTTITTTRTQLVVGVQCDDEYFTRAIAQQAADEHIAETYPGERWEFVDSDVASYDEFLVYYERTEPGPNEQRRNGPDWGTA